MILTDRSEVAAPSVISSVPRRKVDAPAGSSPEQAISPKNITDKEKNNFTGILGFTGSNLATLTNTEKTELPKKTRKSGN
jgi:hypothetical protein